MGIFYIDKEGFQFMNAVINPWFCHCVHQDHISRVGKSKTSESPDKIRNRGDNNDNNTTNSEK